MQWNMEDRKESLPQWQGHSFVSLGGSGDHPKNDFAPKNKHLLSFFPFFSGQFRAFLLEGNTNCRGLSINQLLVNS